MAHTDPRPRSACLVLSIRVAVWIALATFAASVLAAVSLDVQNQFSDEQYVAWSSIAATAMRFDFTAHLPGWWWEILNQRVIDETALTALFVPSVFLILGTVTFHWLARKRLGEQPNFAMRAVLYWVSYSVIFAVSRTLAFLLSPEGPIESFAGFAKVIMRVGGYVAILVGISSLLFFAVVRIAAKKKATLVDSLDSQSSRSPESSLTPAEESALLAQLEQADSRPKTACFALALKVAFWTALVSLVASAILVGVAIEGTFLAQQMNPSRFTAATISTELMAHTPSALSKLYGQGRDQELMAFMLALIPGVIIIVGTILFHWLARKRLGQQLTLAQRTMVYLVSYVIAFLGVRIAALLISGNESNLGKLPESLAQQPQGLLEILGYMTGLIAVGSIISAVFSKHKATA